MLSGRHSTRTPCGSPPGTSIPSSNGSTICWRSSRTPSPTCVCLQEIKCVDEAFPREAVETAGYNVATHGQKGFNGVAILSKCPIEDIRRGLPGGDEDEQARYLEAVIPAPFGVVRVASIYLPERKPARHAEKFDYKLAWMDRLKAHARDLLAWRSRWCSPATSTSSPSLGTPSGRRPGSTTPSFSPRAGPSSASFCNLGLSDAVRLCDDRPGLYTFWDYQAGVMAEGQRHPHRSSAAVAASRRPVGRRRDPQGTCAVGRSRRIMFRS